MRPGARPSLRAPPLKVPRRRMTSVPSRERLPSSIGQRFPVEERFWMFQSLLHGRKIGGVAAGNPKPKSWLSTGIPLRNDVRLILVPGFLALADRERG